MSRAQGDKSAAVSTLNIVTLGARLPLTVSVYVLPLTPESLTAVAACGAKYRVGLCWASIQTSNQDETDTRRG